MKRGASRGFTLIELILTVVVISVGLTGIMVIFENVTRGVTEADNVVVAGNLVREKLEQIVMAKWYSGYAAIVQASYPSETFTGDLSKFTRSTTVQEVSKTDFSTAEVDSGYKRVAVTVTWGARPHQTITIPTILASY